MPRRIVETGPDMLSGAHSGVGSTMDGKMFLADRNLFPDPAMRQFTSSTGRLKGWRYDHAPSVRALNVYVRTNEIGSAWRRASERLPLSHSTVMVDELPSATYSLPVAGPLAAPAEVRGTAYPESQDGIDYFVFDPGHYNLAIAYLLAGGLRTGIGSRIALSHTLTAEHYDLEWGTVPFQVEAVLVYATEAHASAPAAASGDLFLQDIVYDKTLTSFRLKGPWRRGEQPVVNETYVGGANEWGAPEWEWVAMPQGQIAAIGSLELSWTFSTINGRSASQGSVAPFAVAAKQGAAIAVLPPIKPPGALSWRLEFRDAAIGGPWVAWGDTPNFDFPQYVYGADPIAVGGLTTIRRSTTDATGYPNPGAVAAEAVEPTAALDDAIFGATALYPLEGTPALIESGVTESTGQTGRSILDVLPPDGNLLHNPQFTSLVASENGPELWGWTPGAGLSPDLSTPGEITIADTSAAAEALDALYNDLPAPIAATVSVLSLRFALEMAANPGGPVRILARQLNAAGALLVENELFVGTGTTGTDGPMLVRLGDTLDGDDFDLHADAHGLRVVARHEADVTNGRGATWTLSQLGLYEGRAVPPKRDPALPKQGEAEPAERPYPSGGYVTIIEDPTDRPAALDGMDLNAAEYWGPASAALEPGRFIEGYMLPVRPGQDYVLSAYAKPDWIVAGSTLLESVFKDARGSVIGANDPVAEFLSEVRDGAWTRHDSPMTAPPNAAFLEITGSTLGAGLVRIMGIQWEKDTSPSAFDPGIPFDAEPTGRTGTAEWILDLGVDSGAASTLYNLREVRSVDGFEIVGDAPFLDVEMATSHSTAGPWSAWTRDVSELLVTPHYRYLKVRVTIGDTEEV